MSVALLHQAENLSSLLPPLLIEAERVAQTVYQGVHGRRRVGVGETFWQFRHYAPGDSAARIDWRQSGRTDKYFVREREWEAAQSAYLWADASGSMQYASEKNLPLKAERAQLLMLALASLMLCGGEKVVWLDERRHISVHGKAGLENIAVRIGGGASNVSVPPNIPITRHAHMILCSDFLMSDEDLQKLMQAYTARSLRGVFVHIIDPAEDDFAFDGRVEMLGCENEDPMLLPNAAALRDAYRERVAAHKTRLQQLAEGAGWFYTRHITSELPHLALMRVYECLAADHK
jgi:uncharacterized protein (DUF58 family)